MIIPSNFYMHYIFWPNRTNQEGSFLQLNTCFIMCIIIIIIIIDVSCHRPSLPGTSFEPAVIPNAQASTFTLQYFPYYV